MNTINYNLQNMTFKNTFIKLSAMGALALTIQACSRPSAPGIYKDDQIQSGVRKTLHSLQDELLSALKTDDRHAQELLMSQEFIDDVRMRVKVCSEATIRMKKADYSLFREYYIVRDTVGDTTTIKDRTSGINNYDLKVPTLAREMYVAQFIAKKSPLTWMITATYHKLDYGWKIDDMEITPYSENHRTAPEQIAFAQKMLDKKYYLDANNAMVGAMNDLYPSNRWMYEKHDDISKMADLTRAEISANLPLPITVKQLPSEPLIWRITIQYDKEGTFPNINYVSKTNLLDTTALKKENAEFGKIIGEVFEGVDKDKKYIFYTIYNKQLSGPNKGKVDIRDHFDIRQTLQ
ncbi:hypothetical protein [Mucilaginibacter myungsuensis]|uniref:Uncharacterized protein n=1 Tax=Mucilaginibacter myungsuensis TaxID=649104 RepID=A0A929PZP0_9SPHI|nr:hypothetical protein [Mucilaginibacter myungsuensis]MBE9664627.1 hypothetical protein [Mucilaginibacter myungsuensis]MDN3601483.1 hypothetical protein [Mucilaginibacter myungsuensis]